MINTVNTGNKGNVNLIPANPVKEKAEELGIEVFDGKPSDPLFAEKLKEKEVECGAVVAYGRLISSSLLLSAQKTFSCKEMQCFPSQSPICRGYYFMNGHRYLVFDSIMIRDGKQQKKAADMQDRLHVRR